MYMEKLFIKIKMFVMCVIARLKNFVKSLQEVPDSELGLTSKEPELNSELGTIMYEPSTFTLKYDELYTRPICTRNLFKHKTIKSGDVTKFKGTKTDSPWIQWQKSLNIKNLKEKNVVDFAICKKDYDILEEATLKWVKKYNKYASDRYILLQVGLHSLQEAPVCIDEKWAKSGVTYVRKH